MLRKRGRRIPEPLCSTYRSAQDSRRTTAQTRSTSDATAQRPASVRRRIPQSERHQADVVGLDLLGRFRRHGVILEADAPCRQGRPTARVGGLAESADGVHVYAGSGLGGLRHQGLGQENGSRLLGICLAIPCHVSASFVNHLPGLGASTGDQGLCGVWREPVAVRLMTLNVLVGLAFRTTGTSANALASTLAAAAHAQRRRSVRCRRVLRLSAQSLAGSVREPRLGPTGLVASSRC